MEQIKNYASTIATIITLIAALFAFDGRYARAEDTKLALSQTTAKIEQSHKLTEEVVQKATNNLRKQILEDKIFEIDTKQAERKATTVDIALKARYLRQLEEVSK